MAAREKIRTTADARREAEKRWANFAAVKSSKCVLWDKRMWNQGFQGPPRAQCTCAAHGSCGGGRSEKVVGVIELGFMFVAKGCAETWDEAFRRADKQEGR